MRYQAIGCAQDRIECVQTSASVEKFLVWTNMHLVEEQSEIRLAFQTNSSGGAW
jgi:hypothetical protein